MKTHLSIVTVSRNDDHGRAPLERMQQFVDAWDFQCRKFGLSAELVIVEWNPPQNRPPLRDALEWPRSSGPLTIRIVTVPNDVHAGYVYAERLPLYQMIGKNVGIRRARGDFILATNMDVIADDDTVVYLRDNLAEGVLVRADRFDVPASIPSGTVDERLCHWRKSVFHVYTRVGIFDVHGSRFLEFGPLFDIDGGDSPAPSKTDVELLYTLSCHNSALAAHFNAFASAAASSRCQDASDSSFMRAICELYREHRVVHIFACGDFTLLSAQDWNRLAGYPELDAYSWNLDSILLFAACASGIRQVVLPPSHRTFHIDHAVGSGWTPEGDGALFARLRAAQIPYVNDHDLLAWRRRLYETSQDCRLNDTNWGLSDQSLPEVIVSA
jgi:hypothetical protein